MNLAGKPGKSEEVTPAGGFEPPTPGLTARRSTRLSYAGLPEGFSTFLFIFYEKAPAGLAAPSLYSDDASGFLGIAGADASCLGMIC